MKSEASKLIPIAIVVFAIYVFPWERKAEEYRSVVAAPVVAEVADLPPVLEIPVPLEEPAKTRVETLVDVVEPTVVVPPEIKPTILVHSSTDCVYCSQWIKQIPRWEQSGWTVDVTIDLVANPSHKLVPWFEVKTAEYSFTFDGYMTDAGFEAARKKALSR